MGIYGKVKKFFSFLGDIYFRLTDYKNLEEQRERQVNNNLKLSGEVGRFEQRAKNLSYLYKRETKRAEQLALENQGLTNTITNLSEELGGLEKSVRELTEQKDSLSEELSATQKNLLNYQKGVENSPEYIALAKEKARFEARVGGLEEEVGTLKDLCKRRNKTISELQIKIREYDKIKIGQIESVYEQRAKGPDKGHSYIVIREHLKIITSTPEFRKSFNYDDPNKPIKGLNWFKVLKIPEDSPDYISQKQMKELLEDPKEIKLTTTIIDGKGEEKIIRFIKHVPEYSKVGVYNYFYTRVDIYEIGIVERKFGKILRTLHIIDKPPQTIAEFFKQSAITEVKTETDEQKNEILSKKPQENKPRGSWFFGRTKKQDKKE